MQKTNEKIVCYISLTKNYLGTDCYCTTPNSIGGNRKVVSMEKSVKVNKIPIETDKNGNITSIPELKELYCVYRNLPSENILDNMRRSNGILQDRQSPITNTLFKAYIPKGSFVSEISASEIVGCIEHMYLTNNIVIGKQIL